MYTIIGLYYRFLLSFLFSSPQLRKSGSNELWNFPNCLGAIDGKHVKIVPPHISNLHFHNYKGSHSKVLMAVVNENCWFIASDFGVNGRVSDCGVIKNTLFYHKLSEGTLSLPKPQPPPNAQVSLLFVFVSDEHSFFAKIP